MKIGPEAPRVQRVVLLRDGTSVGCFTLRSHETHVVVLEPNGHAYTHTGPSGRASRHLTPTVLSAHRTMVAATVRFRNRYALCAAPPSSTCPGLLPYIHSALGDAPVQSKRRRRPRQQQSEAPSLSVCWPHLDSYATQQLWNDREKSFEIESLDGAARVTLHASGKLVDVQYLLPIKQDTEADDETPTNEELLTWSNQRFPLSATPPCFAFPVRVLTRARIARGCHAESFSVDDQPVDVATPALPGNGAFGARPTFRPLFHRTVTTTDSDNASNGNSTQNQSSVSLQHASVQAIVRWVKRQSRSLDRFVAVEQVDGGRIATLLVVVSEGAHPAVLITSDADTSTPSQSLLLECERGFFRAFDTKGGVAQQFTIETLPLDLHGLAATGGSTDELRSLTARLEYAAKLGLSAHELPVSAASTPTTTTPSSTSVEPVEDVSNELGRFRAFADGRVRVVFADRTILQISPPPTADDDQTENYSFVERDGSTVQCTSDTAASSQRRYVAMAMDFAQWAFATPEQRFRRHLLHCEQQQLIAQELHKISIRQQLNTRAAGRTPPAIDQIQYTTGSQQRDRDALSHEAIAQLQTQTQGHMNHVRTLLMHDAPDQ